MTEADSARVKQLYTYGFTVHELQLTGGDKGIDVAVSVSGGPDDYKTEMKTKRAGWIKFEDSHQWSEVSMYPSEFNVSSMEFKIEKAETFTRNTILGMCSVQLQILRARKNKAFVRKTFECLGNEGAIGNIVLTVFAYGPGDTPPMLGEDADNEDDDAEVKDMTQIIQGAPQKVDDGLREQLVLYMHILRIEYLSDGGTEKYSPYCAISFNGTTLETDHAENASTVSYNKMFQFPFRMPIYDESIALRVFHRATGMMSQDFLIARGSLRMSQLRTAALPSTWFNFYGFSRAEIPDLTALAQTGEHIPENYFLGRILIAGRVQRQKKGVLLHAPKMDATDIKDEVPTKTYGILVDVLEVAGIDAEKCFLEVSYMRQREKTSAITYHSKGKMGEVTGAKFKFKADQGRVATLNVNVPREKAQQVDVFLNLFATKDKNSKDYFRVGYKRIPFDEIQSWEERDSTPHWIAFESMPNLGLGVEPGSIYGTIFKAGSTVTNRVKKVEVKKKKYQLRVYVASARNLSTTSTDRVPKPFIQVMCAGESRKTDTKPPSANPFFCEAVVIDLELAIPTTSKKIRTENIQITAYDEIDTRGVGQKAFALATDFRKEAGNYVATMATGIADMARQAAGDQMAKKRNEDVVNGKLVIGRTFVKAKEVRKKSRITSISPKWITLRGGVSGKAACGDLLIDVELVPRELLEKYPLKSCAPDRKPSTVYFSIQGLRNLKSGDGGEEITKPVITFQMQSFSEIDREPKVKSQEWSAQPPADVRVTPDDTNRKWVSTEGACYEFNYVEAIEVELPILPEWDPAVDIVLSDKKLGKIVGSGRYSIRSLCPWNVLRDGGAAQARAADDFEYDQDSASDMSDFGALEDEEIDEDALFVNTTLRAPWKKDIGLEFDASDYWSFPPTIFEVTDKGFWATKNVKLGDVLLQVADTGNKNAFPCWGVGPESIWTHSAAQEYIKGLDFKKIRPLTLSFRTLLPNERLFRFEGQVGQPLGIAFIEDEELTPPTLFQIQNELWLKAGIGAGWAIHMFCGVDTTYYNSSQFKEEFAKTLKNDRPLVFLMRRPKKGQYDTEKKKANVNEVGLNGLPSVYSDYKKQVEKRKVTNNTLALNMRLLKAQEMHIQGFLNPAIADNTKSSQDRSAVEGELEKYLDNPIFPKIPLCKGGKEIGLIKLRCAVKYKNSLSSQIPVKLREILFNSRSLREMYKKQIPPRILLRVYTIRAFGLPSRKANGASDPYLTYVFGKENVPNVSTKQEDTLAPNFMHREDKEIMLPEKGFLQVGINSYNGPDDSALIGTTTIDLEDRWLNDKYQEMMKDQAIPIEYRTLIGEGGANALATGVLEMWIEMLDANKASEVPASVLKMPPKIECEIRLVAWQVRNLFFPHITDLVEGDTAKLEKIDLKLRCNIDSANYAGSQPITQETDVHFAAEEDGFAEYNWRFVYSNITVSQVIPLQCMITIGLWRHMLGWTGDNSELVAQVSLDFRHYLRNVAKHENSILLDSWIPVTSDKLNDLLEGEDMTLDMGAKEDREEDIDKGLRRRRQAQAIMKKFDESHKGAPIEQDAAPLQKPAGELGILAEVLLQQEANMSSRQVGLGREEPNRDPNLEYPRAGRSWAAINGDWLANLDVFSGFFGAIKRKLIIIAVVIVLLLVLFILFGIRTQGNKGCTVLQNSCCDECSNACNGSETCTPSKFPQGPFSFIQGGAFTHASGVCLWPWDEKVEAGKLPPKKCNACAANGKKC